MLSGILTSIGRPAAARLHPAFRVGWAVKSGVFSMAGVVVAVKSAVGFSTDSVNVGKTTTVFFEKIDFSNGFSVQGGIFYVSGGKLSVTNCSFSNSMV